jgi:hypothetical protein
MLKTLKRKGYTIPCFRNQNSSLSTTSFAPTWGPKQEVYSFIQLGEILISQGNAQSLVRISWEELKSRMTKVRRRHGAPFRKRSWGWGKAVFEKHSGYLVKAKTNILLRLLGHGSVVGIRREATKWAVELPWLKYP